MYMGTLFTRSLDIGASCIHKRNQQLRENNNASGESKVHNSPMTVRINGMLFSSLDAHKTLTSLIATKLQLLYARNFIIRIIPRYQVTIYQRKHMHLLTNALRNICPISNGETRGHYKTI